MEVENEKKKNIQFYFNRTEFSSLHIHMYKFEIKYIEHECGNTQV